PPSYQAGFADLAGCIATKGAPPNWARDPNARDSGRWVSASRSNSRQSRLTKILISHSVPAGLMLDQRGATMRFMVVVVIEALVGFDSKQTGEPCCSGDGD